MRKKKIVRIVTVPQSFRLFEGQMNFLRDEFDFVGVSNDGPHLSVAEKLEGIRIHKIPLSRKISPIQDLFCLLRFIFFLLKERPDVVHSHTPKAGLIGMLGAYIARVPHRVHTVAGMPLLETTGGKRKVLDFVEKLTYACANHVLPNSLRLRDIIIDEKYSIKNKVKVLGNGSSNGVDTNYFSKDQFSETEINDLKKSLKLEENNVVVLSVGRIVKDKGIVELVESFVEFNEKFPESRLLMLGVFEKDLDPIPEHIEKEIEGNQAIIYCGFQKDVRPYFALADLFVFPSYREGFPNVVLQSCAMGLPSIVSNINGNNEIIEDSLNGYIVPVKNKEKILEKMISLMNDKDALKEMGAKGKMIVKEKYERKFVWNEVRAFYNSLK